MLSNLKINVGIAIFFLIVGGYICYKLYSKQEQQSSRIKQEERRSGTITKKTVIKPDGSKYIDEVDVYRSDIKYESKYISSKKTTWSIIPKYSFESYSVSYAATYSYNGLGVYISSDKQVGIILSFSY